VAQFSVYRNKNGRTKTTFPYLVDVQSDLLDPLNTRVVSPMTKAPALKKKPFSQLTPEVAFNGDRYVLMTPQLAGIGRTELGPQVGSLADERQVILAAIDFMLTGF
jgi:toxin CcdB